MTTCECVIAVNRVYIEYKWKEENLSTREISIP